MADRNSVSIKASAFMVDRPEYVAKGINLARLQNLALLAGDEHAPHFVPAQEPVGDGRAYVATDGRQYYRPQLVVTQRAVPPSGPDVRFLKDARGAMRLQFELTEAPHDAMPAGAEPLNVRVDGVTLAWTAGGQQRQRRFDQPTFIAADDPQNPAKPNFSIRVGADLAPDEVEPLYHALSEPAAGARLDVAFSYGYWLDTESTQSPPFTPPEIPVLVEDPRRPRPPIEWQAHRIPSIRQIALADQRVMLNRAALPAPLALDPNSIAAARVQPDLEVAVQLPVSRSMLSRFDAGSVVAILDRARERERESNFRRAAFTRGVSFGFDRNLEQNRPIYAAVEGEDALGTQWEDTGFGLVRKASFPNTVYRLPDEIRLAYNPDLGTPHMIPSLYRDAAGDIRVRVTLRAVPWHDPAQLVRLRDYLRRTSAGALASPSVVAGGYERATLHLRTAFPEQIQMLEGGDGAISIEGGFEMTLDLSLEFYRFLCELLTGPVGVIGEVAVTLETPPAAAGGQAQPRVRPVPMRLSFDDLASLPIAVKVAQDAPSPRQVQIINGTRAEVRVRECVPRLLQYDENSVVPLEVFEATVATAFPVTLAADGPPLTLDLTPRAEDADHLWNAVQLEFIGQELLQAAAQVLDRIHEIAPSGTLAWKIAVDCPLFRQEPPPPQFQNLYRAEVEITRAGFAPQRVMLGRGQPEAQVTMQQTLREIVGADSGTLTTFAYRVRNVYFDHQGQWGEPRTEQGGNLVVFPNPVNND